ncbi:MAG: DUF4058 family protein [Planctomycetota bacterium]
MPSPFPGMDPFLENEATWSTFQYNLLNVLFQVTTPSLVERYRARVLERTFTVEHVLFTSVKREEHREPYLEIRQRSDGKLITQLEAVSPVNKTTAIGRQSYLEKRNEAHRFRANIVEIDLVLDGQRMHDFSRENLPTWDYNVVVTRAPRPEQFELYTSTLEKRLPRFRLPLAVDDRDVVIDLQAVLHRVYDQADFGKAIDYKAEPLTRLDPEQKFWIDKYLREQGLRA